MDTQFDLTGFYDDQIMTSETNQFDIGSTNIDDVNTQLNLKVYDAGMGHQNDNIHDTSYTTSGADNLNYTNR